MPKCSICLQKFVNWDEYHNHYAKYHAVQVRGEVTQRTRAEKIAAGETKLGLKYFITPESFDLKAEARVKGEAPFSRAEGPGIERKRAQALKQQAETMLVQTLGTEMHAELLNIIAELDWRLK